MAEILQSRMGSSRLLAVHLATSLITYAVRRQRVSGEAKHDTDPGEVVALVWRHRLRVDCRSLLCVFNVRHARVWPYRRGTCCCGVQFDQLHDSAFFVHAIVLWNDAGQSCVRPYCCRELGKTGLTDNPRGRTHLRDRNVPLYDVLQRTAE